jgi:hypothetical protein
LQRKNQTKREWEKFDKDYFSKNPGRPFHFFLLTSSWLALRKKELSHALLLNQWVYMFVYVKKRLMSHNTHGLFISFCWLISRSQTYMPIAPKQIWKVMIPSWGKTDYKPHQKQIKHWFLNTVLAKANTFERIMGRIKIQSQNHQLIDLYMSRTKYLVFNSINCPEKKVSLLTLPINRDQECV